MRCDASGWMPKITDGFASIRASPSGEERTMATRPRGFDETADLVIVGAGMAGFCCAIEAANLGATVILLEKEAETGGSSRLSGGSFAFAGTDQQEAAGIEDDSPRMLEDLRRVGQHKNNEALLRAFGEAQLNTWRWLQSLGLTFGSPKAGSGQSVPRTHRADPVGMFGLLGDASARSGRVRLLCQTEAIRLLRADGKVNGVQAAEGNRAMTIGANRGVVLTTGGFMRGEALLENFAPGQAQALRMGAAGCTGDGLRMAWQLGADLCDMGYISGTFGIHPDSGPEDHHFLHSIYLGAIAVNRAGHRFVDESLSYKLVGDACLRQPGAIGFQIFDQTVMERSPADGSSFDAGAELRAGRLITEATVPALAECVDIDATGLVTTLRRYNADVARGDDSAFGRTSLTSGWGKPAPIEHAPFYAYPSRSAVVGTYCGLVVDTQLRVHDVFAAPIRQLLAAGHVTGGFHGAGYMTGTALSKAAVFGRLAARSAMTSSI
jgi:fumarate reductase flavoprotein subunit